MSHPKYKKNKENENIEKKHRKIKVLLTGGMEKRMLSLFSFLLK